MLISVRIFKNYLGHMEVKNKNYRNKNNKSIITTSIGPKIRGLDDFVLMTRL